jgi:hypothetical protein
MRRTHKKTSKKRPVNYSSNNMRMVRASRHKNVSNPNMGTTVVARQHALTSDYMESLAQVMQVRHNFSTLATCAKGSVMPSTGELKSRLDVRTGSMTCRLRDMQISCLLNHPSFIQSFYKQTPSSFDKGSLLQYPENMPPLEEIEFCTSYSFISNLPNEEMPKDFSYISQTDSKHFTSLKLDSREINQPPVFAYLMRKDHFQKMTGSYYKHPFHQLFMSHALTVCQKLARAKRLRTMQRDDDFQEFGAMHLILPAPGNREMYEPTISLVSDNGSQTFYTAYSQINYHSQTYRVEQRFCQPELPGLPWTSLSSALGEVVNRFGFGGHLITHLDLIITIKTWTHSNVHMQKQHKVDITDETHDYFKRHSNMLRPGLILHQVVEVEGRYGPDKPITFQPHGKLVFVTSNRGFIFKPLAQEPHVQHSNGLKKINQHPLYISQHFGNGLSCQVELMEAEKKPYSSYGWYPTLNKSLPAEMFAFAADKVASSAIRELQQPGIQHNALSIPGYDAQTHTTVLTSMKKSFPAPYEEQPIHPMSHSKPYFSCIVVGDSKASPFALQRVRRVVMFAPVGQRLLDAYAPQWDYCILNPESWHFSGMGASGLNGSLLFQSNQIKFDKAADNSDDESFLENIMASAAQPSVFDSEVYMY